jgi:ribosomal protein S18 acetylase RimI-like enzyme
MGMGMEMGMGTRWSVRTATRAELPAVLHLWSAAGAEPSQTDDLAGLEALADRDPGALLVAADGGGRLAGTVIAGWDGWRGSIYRLAVLEEYRRHGVGRLLVVAGEERLRSLGARRLQATVVGTETGAVAFWRAVGWERQEARVRFVRG